MFVNVNVLKYLESANLFGNPTAHEFAQVQPVPVLFVHIHHGRTGLTIIFFNFKQHLACSLHKLVTNCSVFVFFHKALRKNVLKFIRNL